MEKIKATLWAIFNLPKYRIRYWKTRLIRKKLDLMTSTETVKYILDTNCSVSRFGDGELQMMSHYLDKRNEDDFSVDTFQTYDRLLGRRLIEVFQSRSRNHLVCLPYSFKKSNGNTMHARLFWEREWLSRLAHLTHLGLTEKHMGDTNFTRFYMNRKDIYDYPGYITQLKQIWKGRKIVIVEGKFSRLGLGNNIFENVSSIERVICPATNAFSKYDRILSVASSFDKSCLFLIALGHTATVLAYDLSLRGFQAIDVGHIDIEYEWYSMSAKEKVAVPNKYVNEVKSGRIDSECSDRKYLSQVKDWI